MRRRPETSAARRRRLARTIDRVEAVEPRAMITESIGVFSLGIGVSAWASSARTADAAIRGGEARSQAGYATSTAQGPAVLPFRAAATTAGGGSSQANPMISAPSKPLAAVETGWLTLAAKTAPEAPIAPAPAAPGQPGGGGAAPPRGSITPLRLAPPGAPVAPPAPPTAGTPAVVSGSSQAAQGAAIAGPASVASPTAQAQAPTSAGSTGGGAVPSGLGGGGLGGGGIQTDFAGPTSPFPVYVLDQNDGSVMFPGADQVATLGGNVDLRAQVRNTTVSSYSWNTAGLTAANSISGSATFDLTFQWNSSVATATTNSVTLTVTNSASQTVTQTFTFAVPAGTGTAGTGTTTWPESTTQNLELASAPAFATHNASVDAASGALDAAIALPSYNPGLAPIALTYDSIDASPRPVVVEHHTIDPAQAEPSRVTAQLTFGGTAASTYYYDSSTLVPGDVMQVALQASTTPATGRYAYTATMGDVRGGSTTTTTSSGTATVLNGSANAFGAGWTLAGLEQLDSASGGMILDLGGGDRSLWFAASGGSYVTPAGDFSTLAASGGGYLRTLTDGTKIAFNSSGQEISTADSNGVTTSFAYSGGALTTITDPYGKVTTFSYSGGLLSTITDPASRIATFTHSGSNLAGVTLPDSSTWAYGYDGSGHLTKSTDPDSKAMTFVYDSGGAVVGTQRPDSTTETFAPYQRQGWVAPGSGTSGSPAAATLLAEAAATYTDPNGNATALRPDWRGQGLVDTAIDPLGNVASTDRDANGLATIAVDPLNRITRVAYDSHANVTKTTYPDGTTSSATYNGLAEPLTTTDELNRTVSYTYDSGGNNTNTKQPLGVNSTMTYDARGLMTSDSNPGGYYASGFVPGGPPSPGGGPISYTYDSQERLLTKKDALGETTSYSYDSAGDLTSVQDPNGHFTTMTYDGMGRTLTTKDALGDVTTDVYDAAGNEVAVVGPLGHRTTTGYDSMDRAVTVTDALLGVTTYTYDSGGRETSIKDSVGNLTAYGYDADGRQTGSTDPNGYLTTTSYDADGEVTQTIDRDGRTINYGYDLRGRQTTEAWASGGTTLETITDSYDAAGEVTMVTDGTTVLTFAYDNDGRQTGAGTSGGGSGQPAVVLTSVYYDSGALAKLTDSLSSAGITSYGYDAAFRMASIATNFSGSNQEIDFAYDSGGRTTAILRYTVSSGMKSLNSATTSYAYDAADRVTGIADAIGNPNDGYASPFASQSYTYDSGGRTTSETNAEGAVSYAYDVIDELTGVSGARAEAYTYDHNGNRTMAGYSTATNNELAVGAGYTYAYDHEGNLTGETQTSTGNATTFAYDYRNRMTGATERSSGGTILHQATYTYDALDRRIGVKLDSTQTWTVYDGQNPYADFNGSGTLQQRYVYGPAVDEILSRTSSGGSTAWYLADKLGSVRDLVNTSGTVIDHVAYDSFGNVTAESGGGGDRFKYAGMQLDAAIGLDYDRARYYNPTAGRFVSQDPTKFNSRDTNFYRYTFNNPVRYTDISGLGVGAFAAGYLDGYISGTIFGEGPIIFKPIGAITGGGTGYQTGYNGGIANGVIMNPVQLARSIASAILD